MSLEVVFTHSAWEDYLFWQNNNLKISKRINQLIKECMRHPFTGIGKPEALKFSLSGFWSRRINDEHRIVYKVDADKLFIIQCRYHY